MSFKAVQNKIAEKEGIPKARAGAILAASTRKASPEARRKNSKLNKVSGMPPTNKKSGGSIFHMKDL